MAKAIYRICLIVCLAIAIGAGLFFYERQREHQEDQREWTLVWQDGETGRTAGENSRADEEIGQAAGEAA